ncbi:MAG: putative bifunctional diguanylate cyclase/phosphodiesterase [Beijerinckiaceae bacterium]
MSNLSLNHSPKVAPIDPACGTDGGKPQACSKPRILVVDDVADNRILLARLFQRRNFDIVEADCGTRALELVAASSFDAILLDVNMPYMSGLEVLQEIRRKHSPETLPVIMVTGNNQSADIVAALEMGANDYVAKPVQFSVALARVNAQVERKQASEALALANAALNQSNEQLERRVFERTARLVEANQQLKNEMEARQRSEAQTQYLAYHDVLTGLGNRLLFREELQRALRELPITMASLAILFIDLDGFKSINDVHGHSVGDALLKALASRMLDSLGNSVRIARLGGDEFAVLQVSCGQPEGAMSLADQIIELIGAPCHIDAHDLNVGASIGIAVGNGEHEDAEFLLKAADLAMYRAKADGGGTYRVFDPQMDAAAQAALRRKLEMRNALVNGDFELHYQPIVSVDSRQVTTCEALLRWNHEELGWIAPNEFIPVAENSGLIVQLGEWVLRTACAEAVGWPASVKIAVNLSPVQFQNGKLVASVFSALTASGLDPTRLELEITESVLLGNNDRNATILNQLRELGVRISLDDFGTGFSSLSYLRSFPFDKIKIDQSFIRNLADDGRSQTIVSAIAGLGLSFGMTTTAEGVETQEQMECVIGKGCSEIQGYFYSRPVPGSELLSLIHRINDMG